jgi:hypothetical protein
MASVELPQKSSHLSHLSIDLYPPSAKLNLQFVSNRKCPGDSQPLFDHSVLESSWRSQQNRKAHRAKEAEDVAGMSGASCVARPSLAPEGMLPEEQQNLKYEPRLAP